MMLYYDNQDAIQIAENSVFHEYIKHIAVDCHLVYQKVEEKVIQTRHVSSEYQLAYLLTKPFEKTRVDFVCDNWECMIYMLQLEGECW